MYSVLIVEDEPTAMEHLKTMIEQFCPDYYVAGLAANGSDALELMREKYFNLVITDIKMPIMDGLEFAQIVQAQYPQSNILIVSGYQEFEFAREAMKAGVFEYLLKPISPSSLKTTLAGATARVLKEQESQQERILQRMAHGAPVDIKALTGAFGSGTYYIALARKNGLPPRFTQLKTVGTFSREHDHVNMYGRDEMEKLCVAASETMTLQEFVKYVVNSPVHSLPGYQTTVICPKSLHANELPIMVRALYDTLRQVVTLGKNQTVYIDTLPTMSSHKASLSVDTKVFELHFQSGNIQGFKNEIYKLLKKMQENDEPLLEMENQFKRILMHFQKSAVSPKDADSMAIMVERVFSEASGIEDLMNLLMSEISEKIMSVNVENQKIDSESFFFRIRSYIDNNLSEAPSLQELSNLFSLSQAYLSRLFRKYTGNSYSEYITRSRIDKACEYLRNNPKLLVREVADMVGYSNPFYFSRLFSSAVGISPSQFADENRKE